MAAQRATPGKCTLWEQANSEQVRGPRCAWRWWCRKSRWSRRCRWRWRRRKTRRSRRCRWCWWSRKTRRSWRCRWCWRGRKTRWSRRCRKARRCRWCRRGGSSRWRRTWSPPKGRCSWSSAQRWWRRRPEMKKLGEKTQMKSKANIMTSSKFFVIACAIVNCAFLVLASQGAPEQKQESTAAASQPQRKQFDTPKQAADALIQVAANFDVAATKEILGPDGEDIISSEDPVMDKNRALAFAAKAKEKSSTQIDKKDPNRAILLVGNDDFPLPIPIVKRKGKWSFDTKVGREEILNRRIGENELNAIEICRGFVEAQHEYAQEKHDDSKVNHYAQQVLSTPGKHDGLAWKNEDGTWGGPVGEKVAEALAQGYSDKSKPYHGYYFKVLKGQGPAAPMGQMDFVVE